MGVQVPLVARTGVLAEVGSALAAARAGRGTLLTVTGEPGIGKTRLAEEAAERAGGFAVVWTWGPAAAGVAALGPWSRVLRVLAGGHAAVARLIADSPFLAALTDPARAGGGRDPEGARSQLSFDLAEVVAAAAAIRPLLVVFDDAHQADMSSLRLLAELAPALRTMPAAVLVTARDSDRDWHGRLDMRTALLRSGVAISLRPLADGDIAAVVASLTGGPARPDLVSVIAERSAGNPFLVTELARQLAGPGADPAAARAIVPDSVRALAGARIAELAGPARDVLLPASVLGTRFRRDVLAGLAGVQPGQLASALAAGRDARLVEPAAPGVDRFRHDLVRDAIYDSISPGAREDLHARAGEVLASLAGRGRDVDDAEVAYHLVRAGTDAAGPAAEYARRAGDLALAALAFEDAVHWYKRAADSLTALRAGHDDQARAALRLGAARLAVGDLDGGRAAFRHAAERARRAGRPDLLARAALGLGGGPAGFEVGLLDGEQISLLEEARSELPDGQGALIALVTARLSIASTLILAEPRRLELATEAVRQARSAGDDAALAAALAALCDATAGPDHCAARRAHATEIIDLAARLRDPVLGLLGRRLRLVALLEAGAIADWEADVLAYRATAEALRHPLYAWYVPLWRGMRALATGRFGPCRAALAEAAAIGERAASGNATMLVHTQLWCLHADEGDTAGLLAMLGELDKLPVPAPWIQVTRALVLAQAGRTEDAGAQLEAVVPLLPAMARDSEWLPSMAQIAETIALTGPHPVARWAYDALLPYAGLVAVEGICAAVRGPVHRHLALLADALGEHEPASGHRAAAVAGARALGATALAARIEQEAPAVRPVHDDHAFRRDGEVWTLAYGGRAIRMRDSKGLRDLHALLARPGTAVAALDLAAGPVGTALDRTARDRTALGGRRAGTAAGPDALHPPSDTGEVIDARARAAYRQRLCDLEEAAAEADEAADIERSARIAAERDALIEALTGAYGLGGRVRRSGSAAERARTAVTARIRDAIRRIGDAHPDLGRHLDRSVRTGTFCVYEPYQPVRWSL
jgi:hypothetical protein